ncbi:ABC transporter ATP-binding protein [Xenorhabdus miraniensis]|uniref:Daunorubicin-DIM-transport ATP-binding protein ABC transporter DrrA n=1 Tax=Xenorhabdus miraniensis TaxID=351674 RepID=A0A2D0JJJ5_9GAMM|nr:ATP-binding cassette domain-containing protein [Xenorhabdus miraniensis]PHM46483.1 daunorubicin-DIM-transport ATP-binding protein ABC transporter DrrA [Xenorhabdus miraniensis]
MINVEKLTKSFAKKKVLDKISFNVAEGESFAILGSNGAGKSTVVKILTTCLIPDSGTVKINRYDLRTQASEIRKCISVVSQNTALDEQLTATENLSFFGKLFGIKSKNLKQIVHQQLVDFNLVDEGYKRVSDFSGGMKRRLDLAVGLINRPKILFLDEPTTGLDPVSRHDLWETVKKLKSNNTTIILTTQYLEEADQLADNLILINDGKICASGNPEKLKHQYGKFSASIYFSHHERLAVAQQIMTKFGIISIDAQQFCINIVLNHGVASFIELMKNLDKASIELADVKFSRPSLDDLFCKITSNS